MRNFEFLTVVSPLAVWVVALADRACFEKQSPSWPSESAGQSYESTRTL